MRRKLLPLLLISAILVSCSLTAYGASDLPLVFDNAGLLTPEEERNLEDKAQTLGEEYGLDAAILTVDRLNGKRPQDYADDFYDDQGYGDDGVLFLLAMEERDWYISTCGQAIYALTDYSIQQLGDTLVPYLSDGDYYAAFDLFLRSLPGYMDALEQGAPIDGNSDGRYRGGQETVVYYERESSPNVLLAAALGLAAAAVTVGTMAWRMNSRRPKYSAGDYLQPGSYHLRRKEDLFLYSRVSKVRRQENNSHGGGGSSVHMSSGGRSHGGGGGKF